MPYSKSVPAPSRGLVGLFDRLIAYNNDLNPSSAQDLHDSVTTVLQLLKLGVKALPQLQRVAPYMIAGSTGMAADMIKAAFRLSTSGVGEALPSVVGGALAGAALGLTAERIAKRWSSGPKDPVAAVTTLLELAAESKPTQRRELIDTAVQIPLSKEQLAVVSTHNSLSVQDVIDELYLPTRVIHERNMAMVAQANTPLMLELKSILAPSQPKPSPNHVL